MIHKVKFLSGKLIDLNNEIRNAHFKLSSWLIVVAHEDFKYFFKSIICYFKLQFFSLDHLLVYIQVVRQTAPLNSKLGTQMSNVSQSWGIK